MTSLAVKPVVHKSHAEPSFKKLKYEYIQSPDGQQSNLLIMLHGLGDTLKPFASLSRSLKLSQTDILVLQARDRIPLLEEEAYEWYESFNGLGELIQSPDPRKILEILGELVEHLTKSSSGPGWRESELHWFGFAQGGSVAAQMAVRHSFGSLVTVSGPLLSFPTGPASETPVLASYRPHEERQMALSSFRKGFVSVTEHKMSQGGQGMPRSRMDWEPIMRFWSQKLTRRSALEQGDDVYEIQK